MNRMHEWNLTFWIAPLRQIHEEIKVILSQYSVHSESCLLCACVSDFIIVPVYIFTWIDHNKYCLYSLKITSHFPQSFPMNRKELSYIYVNNSLEIYDSHAKLDYLMHSQMKPQQIIECLHNRNDQRQINEAPVFAGWLVFPTTGPLSHALLSQAEISSIHKQGFVDMGVCQHKRGTMPCIAQYCHEAEGNDHRSRS